MDFSFIHNFRSRKSLKILHKYRITRKWNYLSLLNESVNPLYLLSVFTVRISTFPNVGFVNQPINLSLCDLITELRVEPNSFTTLFCLNLTFHKDTGEFTRDFEESDNIKKSKTGV